MNMRHDRLRNWDKDTRQLLIKSKYQIYSSNSNAFNTCLCFYPFYVFFFFEKLSFLAGPIKREQASSLLTKKK